MANPKLAAGDAAPAFTLETDAGGKLSLGDLKGQRFILYFYPRDDTPGCTAEACDFRDNMGRLEKELGLRVLGVSPDGVASHQTFKKKYGLPFTLLADPHHEAAEAFGVWREKTNYGKKFLGLVRSTFVVGADGRIERVYDNVKATGHVDRIVKDLG